MSADQFDARYRLQPHRMGDSVVRRRSRFVVDEELRALAALARRPSSIAFFEEALRHERVPPDARLIGYFCNMIPVEIVYALGGLPVRLGCGNAALVQPGEELLSGEICPLAKASFASFVDPDSLANRCEVVLCAASCDAKRKLGEVLSDWKPVFMFNLPPEQDSRRYASFAVKELRRLVDFLSRRLGAKLRTRALRKAIDLCARRTQLVRRLQAARARNPQALSIRDLFVIVQASWKGVPLETWLAEAEKVVAEVEHVQAEPSVRRPRLVLTGAPVLWPNFKVLNLIEQSGGDVVADTLCSGAQSCFDPVVVEERGRTALLRALALRYVFASPCPCFISQGRRITRVLDLAKEHKADGVIHYGLRLCQLFDMETYRLSRTLKGAGVPLLNLRTDYSLEDTEQLRVRIEAFLETLGEKT
ncbi:MAG: 2-hydroxyacyl-CoA dehydratase family protein [Planctomycetota bacterium]